MFFSNRIICMFCHLYLNLVKIQVVINRARTHTQSHPAKKRSHSPSPTQKRSYSPTPTHIQPKKGHTHPHPLTPSQKRSHLHFEILLHCVYKRESLKRCKRPVYRKRNSNMMILTRRAVTTQNPEKSLHGNGQFTSEKSSPGRGYKNYLRFP